MATVFPDRKKADSIVQVFGKYPDGLTITKIASRMKMNRNLAAKYLDYLMRSGQLEMKSIGSAKHYSLSRRVPVSSLMDFSSDLILMLDNEDCILKTNDRFLSYLGEKSDTLVGKNVRDTGNPFISSFAERLEAFDRDTRAGQVSEVSGRVNGEENHFTLQLIPIIFEEGATGTALILHDVTADRNYRQIRDVTAAQNEGLEEDRTEFIIRFSPDGSLTYMNRAFCRFFRRPHRECTGRSFRSLILEVDQQIIDEALAPHDAYMLCGVGLTLNRWRVGYEDNSVVGVNVLRQFVTRTFIDMGFRRTIAHDFLSAFGEVREHPYSSRRNTVKPNKMTRLHKIHPC